MSTKNADNARTIGILQRRLRQRGFYRGIVDEWGGNDTRAALDLALPELAEPPATTPKIVQPAPVIVSAGAALDDRSQRNLVTLLPQVQGIAAEFIRECVRKGYDVRIISGTRTFEEQDRLYRQASDGIDNDKDGRTDEADERVTKAPGGYSNHNFGLAFDVGIFRGKKYLTSGSEYGAIAKLAKAMGLEWGGDWKSFQDPPHYQLRPSWATGMRESDMLAELRRRKRAGISFFA